MYLCWMRLGNRLWSSLDSDEALLDVSLLRYLYLCIASLICMICYRTETSLRLTQKTECNSPVTHRHTRAFVTLTRQA